MTSVGSYRNTAHRKQQEGATTASLSSAANSVSKYKPPRRTSFPSESSSSSFAPVKDSVGNGNGNGVPGRVRVAVRLRPRNEEEKVADADFADCVEVHPEFKRLKLRKNNWDSDTYEFDEVLAEFSSQRRVYEVVAKPVVESVLDGCNGTIMAYGQTGTGKTYTLGRLGDDDIADRGIMVRAMEDILTNISSESDSVLVSYLQLYMETVQDMLDPSNDVISIVDDPKTGDVSLPGATSVRIRDQKSFLELLQLGEAHRYAANTNLNTESSRSHAILVVTVKRPIKGKESPVLIDNGHNSGLIKNMKAPIVRKAKLVIVDLAGSERVTKSGSEGHNLEEAKSINLSLSALGKCINALAENKAHVPFRDSKLTRLLRDSFGGTARTSLVVTIAPSPRHRGETTSTILFGQRAMKVENMVRIKEEFDYKSLCRRLELQIERLTADHERQLKISEDNAQNIRVESRNRIGEAEMKHKNALECERVKYQAEYMESLRKLEEQWANQQKLASKISFHEEIAQSRKVLQKEVLRRETAEEELNDLRNQLVQWKKSEAAGTLDQINLHKLLEDETRKNEKLEEDILVLQSKLVQTGFQTDETRKKLNDEVGDYIPNGTDSLAHQNRSPQPQFSEFVEKASVAKLFEQVGLQKILSLLEAEDGDVRIHAVKVVANLAAEEANQKKIVEAGGLSSLLTLLKTSNDETIHRVAAGALANLAMSESNQDLIMAQGGMSLLSKTAASADDPQTLRMVAGAVANLCGNDKLQKKLRDEGGIRALLGMVRSRHPDVLSQVARGIANFAKCESRGWTQGTKTGRSLLIEDGALPWIIRNANNEVSQVRRHLELALCHLAQHEVNAKDMILSGALWELVRISQDCVQEDIRTLADRILASSPLLQAELRRTY